MGCCDDLKALLAPLGLYDLSAGARNEAELFDLGAALDGVDAALTAGTIVAGAYFGDRCSPASSSAALVAGRLAQLRLALRTTGDQEEARRLRRRIAELRPMLEQCRRLTQLTARYYDRSFCGYGEYRI